MFSFEFTVLDWIQVHLRSEFGDLVMPFFSALGNGGLVWLVLAASLLILPNYRKTGYAVLIALVLDVLCCNVILKPLIARIRPCDVNTVMQLLISCPSDFSFPSGHTAASFAAASALFFSRKKIWIPAAVLAASIAFSRLYLYVHYPTDVLAGVMIGILAGFAGWRLACLGETRLHKKEL